MKTICQGQRDFRRGRTPRLGIVLVNLGTPEFPTPDAVRRYLGEFLSATRVVEIPRLVWKIILHGIILRVRPKKSAHAYASVWTEAGSPLRVFSEALTGKVQHELERLVPAPVAVELAMQGRDSFLQAGGEQFDYIPALNDAAAHATLQAARILQHASGWPETSADFDRGRLEAELAKSRTFARAAGATG